MLKVALVDPPARNEMINPMPVLGLATLRTFLQAKGYQVETIDLNVRIRYLNRYPMRKIVDLNIFNSLNQIVEFLESENVEIEREIEKRTNKNGNCKQGNAKGKNQKILGKILSINFPVFCKKNVFASLLDIRRLFFVA